MTPATAVLAACCALYLALQAFRSRLSLRIARGERDLSMGPHQGEGVAVVQAILGGDPRLGELLEANLEELSEAHFYWLVDEDDPEGQRVCRDLVARRSRSRMDILLFPPSPEHQNPKLFKLEGARAAIAEPVLLVLDDDTWMPAQTLAVLVRRLEEPATGVATSLPGYRDDGRWPSRLLAQFVNNNAALTYLPLLTFRSALTTNGMAYAMRRDVLASMGGFAPLLGSLTDDLAVAEAVLASGRKIIQISHPHWVQTTVRGLRHYVQLLHRWYLFALLLVRKQPPVLRAAIVLLNAPGPVLLWGLLVSAFFVPRTLGLLAVFATLGSRSRLLWRLQRAVYGEPLHAFFSSLLSELLQPFHLLHALAWRRIVWRKRRYRVIDDRHFEALR